MRRVVIVGGSLAGLRAAEALRREAYDGSITIIGDEHEMPYNRPPLSKGFLSGAEPEESLTLPNADRVDADWQLGTPAVGLDPARRRVLLEDGREIDFDGAVLATGAVARRLPGVPLPARGVHHLRTLADARALHEDLVRSSRLVVIGGGLVGTEVASTARGLGLDVTVVSPDPILERVAGELAGRATQRLLDAGVQVRATGVRAVVGDERPTGVVLNDGSTIPAEVVVVAIGAIPATAWLGDALPVGDGIVCDSRMRVVGHPNIVAAGDVACWPHPLPGGLLRLEHWTNASEQAVAAARALLHGDDARPYGPVPYFWSDQFGVRLQGLGLPGLADRCELREGDPGSGDFVAEFLRGDTVVAALAAGRPRVLLKYRVELVRTCCPPAITA